MSLRMSSRSYPFDFAQYGRPSDEGSRLNLIKLAPCSLEVKDWIIK